jgi:phosphoglycerate kinase
MAKKTIRDLSSDLSGKRGLVRLDLNVGVDDETGEIRNDRRIRASLDTLKHLVASKASLIVMSHLGRPKPGADPAKNAPYQMNHVAERLSQYLKQPVAKADDVCGPDARAKAGALKPGEILLLENVRFDPREQPIKDATEDAKRAHEEAMAAFADELASLGDFYVNDAFGTLQNKDVSVLALPKAMKGKPRVIGFLVEKELHIIDNLLASSQRPMLAVMGGAKVSDKIKFIEVLLDKVDRLLIGGKMTYTFLKAQGVDVGAMSIDEKDLDEARKLVPLVGKKIVLPIDNLVAHKDDLGRTLVVEGAVPADFAGVDIGPKTIEAYSRFIAEAATVIWNGPVGWFEKPPFDRGTRAIAQAMAGRKPAGATTVVGGGETAEAVEKFGMVDSMSHVSTGGGAFLKYVEERKFKSLDVIDDA